MKQTISFAVLVFLIAVHSFVNAQISKPATPPTDKYAEARLSAIPTKALREHNVDSLKKAAKDESCTTCKTGGVWGYNNQVQVNLLRDGHMSILPDGGKIWRYAFSVSYALALQVHFDSLKIPAGGELFIYNADRSMTIGAFTEKNNEDGGGYAVQPVSGNSITLEYHQPKGVDIPALISIETVVADFEGILKSLVKPVTSSVASCTKDVACYKGLPHYDEMVKSVGLILTSPDANNQYTGWCSGTLLNNTKIDGIPYFMTAKHCFPSDISPDKEGKIVILFGYESPNCDGTNATAPQIETITGVEYLTGDHYNGDYLLFRLREKIPMKYKVCYAGWDASDKPVLAAGEPKYAVHHASGDIKRISFTNNEVSLDLVNPTDITSPWYSVRWDGNGVTKGGASGSGLFNKDGKFIADLNSGYSSCEFPFASDRYGRFSENFKNGKLGNYLASNYSVSMLQAINYQINSYCPFKEYPITCSNGMKDSNEDGIDCGGSCPVCDVSSSITEWLELSVENPIVAKNEKVLLQVKKNFSGTEYRYKWRSSAFVNMPDYTVFTTDDNLLPEVYFQSKSNKNIYLDVLKDNEIILSKSVNINVGDLANSAQLDFSSNEKQLEINRYTQLQALITPLSSYKVLWNFGPGVVCGPDEYTKSNPFVSWNSEGGKDITLTVIDDAFQITRITKHAFVNVMGSSNTGSSDDPTTYPPIHVNFYAQEKACENDFISFINATPGVTWDNSFYSVTWDFGDGLTSNEIFPTHSYSYEGNYTITLKVCNPSFCAQKSKSIEIVPFPSGSYLKINGVPWKNREKFYYNNIPYYEPSDPPVNVGQNTPVTFEIVENTQWVRTRCAWDLYFGSQDPFYKQNGCGIKKTYYLGNGLRTVQVQTPGGSIYNFTATNCINVVPGLGPGGCEGEVDRFSIASTCYTGSPIEFNVVLKNTTCKIDYRIVGSKSGTWPANTNKINYFDATTVFPYTETFQIQAVQFDGINYTVLDEKTITYTFQSGLAFAGDDFTSCPNTSIPLGMTGQLGVQYTWTSKPANAIQYLSDPTIANPIVNIPVSGNFIYTLSSVNLTKGCASSDEVIAYVSPVSVRNTNYEVSKGETAILTVGASGGSKVFNSYTWSPQTLLSVGTGTTTTFQGTTSPGTYSYEVLVADSRGCTGRGLQKVLVSATAPSGLLANCSSSKIFLTWMDNSETETEFLVYKSNTLDGTYTQVAILPPNSTYYLDPSTVFGIEYFYRVQAKEADRSLGYSNKVRGIREFDSSPEIPISNGSDKKVINKVIKLEDGSFMQVGTRNFDYYIAKLSSCGVVLWEKTYGSYGFDYGRDIIQTQDGGFLIGGESKGDVGKDRTQTNGMCNCVNNCFEYWDGPFNDLWLLKIGPNGGLEWQKSYRGAENDYLNFLMQSSDGGYYLAGKTDSYSYTIGCTEKNTSNLNNPNNVDGWLIKISSTGTVEWERVFETNYADQEIQKILEFPDRTVLVCLNVYSNGLEAGPFFDQQGNAYTIDNRHLKLPTKGESFVWFVKTDANGTKLWEKTVGGENLDVEDGEIIVSGTHLKIAGGNVKLIDFKQKPDGSYLLYANVNSAVGNDVTTSSSKNDYWCFELGADFSIRKSYKFGGSEDDNLMNVNSSLSKTIFYGSTNSPVSEDKAVSGTGIWMVESDNQGNKLKEALFPCTSQEWLAAAFEPSPGVYQLFMNRKDNPPFMKYYYDPEVISALRTGVVSPLTYYLGDQIQVSYTSSICLKPGNIFSVQLSDENGSFGSPKIIGTLNSISPSGLITANIPFDVIPGNSYRVRIVSSNMALTGKDNGNYITIKSPDITTGQISPLSYSPGASMVIGFTVKGNMQSGNIFKVELSDADGYFSITTILGTIAGTSSNGLTVTLPSNVPWSNRYRVRVTSTSPIAEGTDNGSDIQIGELFTINPEVTTYYVGGAISIAYDAVRTYSSGNIFSLQLSDPYGSFTNPVVIGTIASSTSGAISGVLPMDALPGDHYKVRVVASSPNSLGKEITTELTILPQEIITNIISPKQYGTGAPMTVNYTTKGGFQTGNSFVVQLSDKEGSFVFPIQLGQQVGVSSGGITITLPSFVMPGIHYRVRVVSTLPGVQGDDNGEDLVISPLITEAISPLSYTPGSFINVSYTSQFSFAAGNIFTAQLSDENGSFLNAQNIGSLVSSVTGVIQAQLPFQLPIGSKYRVRVVSSDFYIESNDNGQDISVGLPTINLGNISAAGLCRSNPIAVPFTVSSNFASDNSFSVVLSDANGDFTKGLVVGTLAGTTNGSIDMYIPEVDIIGGAGYKVKIVSTNPVAESQMLPIEIQNPVLASDKGNLLCEGQTMRLSIYTKSGQVCTWFKDDVQVASGVSYLEVSTIGTYKATINEAATGCVKTTDLFGVGSVSVPKVTVTATPNTLCEMDNKHEKVEWASLPLTNPNVDKTIINANAIQQLGNGLQYLDGDGMLYYVIKQGDAFLLALGDVYGGSLPLSLSAQKYAFNILGSVANVYYNSMQTAPNQISIAVGDTLKIRRLGTEVNYMKNNVLIRSIPSQSTGRLLVNVWTNKQVSDVRLVKFTPVTLTASVVNPTNSAYSLRWFDSRYTMGVTTNSITTYTSKENPVSVELMIDHQCGTSFVTAPIINYTAAPSSSYSLSITPSNSICNVGDFYPTWRKLNNVQVDGTSVKRNKIADAWDAGALSIEPVGANMYAEMAVLSYPFAMGLSYASNSDNGFTMTNYSFVRKLDNSLSIIESGVSKYTVASYAVGDILHIGVEAGKVVYYVNRLKIYTSTVLPTDLLYVDIALNKSESSCSVFVLKNRPLRTFSLSGTNGSGATQWYLNRRLIGTGNSIASAVIDLSDKIVVTYKKDASCENRFFEKEITLNQSVSNPSLSISSIIPAICNGPQPKLFNWVNLQNSTINTNGGVTLGSATSGGANSSILIVANSGVEYKINDLTGTRTIGISTAINSGNPGNINFGFYLVNNRIYVKEGTTIQLDLGQVAFNDVIRIAYENSRIRYFVNSKHVYESSTIPSVSLVAAVGIFTSGKSIDGFTIYSGTPLVEFSSIVQDGDQPLVSWFVNGVLIRTGVTTFNSSYLKIGDIVNATLLNTGNCSLQNPVTSNSIKISSLSVADLTLSNPTLCKGSPVLMSVPASANATYQWYKNSMPVVNANSNSFSVEVAGSYYVKVTENGCERNSENKTFTLEEFVSFDSFEIPICTYATANSKLFEITPDKRTYLSFNGQDSKFNRNEYIDCKSTFTIEFWSNPTALASYTSGSSTFYRYAIHPEDGKVWGTMHSGVGVAVGTNGVRVLERFTDYQNFPLVEKSIVTLNWTGAISVWTHIAVVYTNGTPSLFINGVKVATGTKLNTTPHLGTKVGGGPMGFYKGNLDDLRFWSKAKSEAEVLAQFTARLSGTESMLITNWRMDEGKGVTLFDISSKQNHQSIDGIVGITWGGYAYIWEDSPMIVSNYGTRLEVLIGNNTSFNVKAISLSPSNGCSISRTYDLVRYEPLTVEVRTPTGICPGEKVFLAAERFPYFDGASGFISNSNLEIPGNNYALTFTAWVKVASNRSQDAGIFSVGTNADGVKAYVALGSNKLIYHSGNRMDLSFWDEIDYSNYIDKWTHIALVLGDKNDPMRRIYINGQEVKKSYPNFRSSNSIYGLNLGKIFNDKFMKGTVRDVRVYKADMGPFYINEMYKGAAVSAQHLIAHYKLNEGRGTYAMDYSFSKFAGVISTTGISWMNDSRIGNLNWSPFLLNTNIIQPIISNSQVVNVSGTGPGGCLTNDTKLTLTTSASCIPFNAALYSTNKNMTIKAESKKVYDIKENDFTIEARININPGENGGTILTTSGDYYRFNVHARPNRTVMRVFLSKSENPLNNFPLEFIKNTNLADGLCHHVAFVRSGSSMKFIFDGVEIGSTTIPGLFGLYKANESALLLGGLTENTKFSGKISEVRIWNIARTIAQINANKDLKLTSSETNLIADWDVSEYESQFIYDRSAQDNTAILGVDQSIDLTTDPVLVQENCVTNPVKEMIQENENEELLDSIVTNVYLYPNPTSSSGSNLRINGVEELESRIRITTLNGVILEEKTIENNRNHTILENAKQGMYLLQIYTNAKQLTYKIIVY